jgi:hypothetical protein
VFQEHHSGTSMPQEGPSTALEADFGKR